MRKVWGCGVTRLSVGLMVGVVLVAGGCRKSTSSPSSSNQDQFSGGASYVLFNDSTHVTALGVRGETLWAALEHPSRQARVVRWKDGNFLDTLPVLPSGVRNINIHLHPLGDGVLLAARGPEAGSADQAWRLENGVWRPVNLPFAPYTFGVRSCNVKNLQEWACLEVMVPDPDSMFSWWMVLHLTTDGGQTFRSYMGGRVGPDDPDHLSPSSRGWYWGVTFGKDVPWIAYVETGGNSRFVWQGGESTWLFGGPEEVGGGVFITVSRFTGSNFTPVAFVFTSDTFRTLDTLATVSTDSLRGLGFVKKVSQDEVYVFGGWLRVRTLFVWKVRPATREVVPLSVELPEEALGGERDVAVRDIEYLGGGKWAMAWGKFAKGGFVVFSL